jgi:hypothetical protein
MAPVCADTSTSAAAAAALFSSSRIAAACWSCSRSSACTACGAGLEQCGDRAQLGFRGLRLRIRRVDRQFQLLFLRDHVLDDLLLLGDGRVRSLAARAASLRALSSCARTARISPSIAAVVFSCFSRAAIASTFAASSFLFAAWTSLSSLRNAAGLFLFGLELSARALEIGAHILHGGGELVAFGRWRPRVRREAHR